MPTLIEQGHADLVVREWFGFFMSGRSSTESVEAASKALREALEQPQLVTQFVDSGMFAASSTPAAMAARIAVEQRYSAALQILVIAGLWLWFAPCSSSQIRAPTLARTCSAWP